MNRDNATGVISRQSIVGIGGHMTCTVLGPERPQTLPLLMIHSINAAASRCEMAPLAEAMSDSRRIYNLDLPGFGESDKPPLHYTVDHFVDAIRVAVQHIQRQENVAQVHAIALSLSCEFLARAAVQDPALFRSLTFISPTGFQKGGQKLTGPEEATFEQSWLSYGLKGAVGRGIYKVLTTRPSILFFLRRTFGSANVDPRIVTCAFAAADRPGAEHAPLAFVSGRLFSRDIFDVYQRLSHPVWLAHGTRGVFSDFSAASWTQERDNWHITAYDAGAMPHVEQTVLFAQALSCHVAAHEDLPLATRATGT